ncbi:MAG: hypothetical protein HY273_10370 [Gammaproteobacteria bacterium]|nr:hypothetical protein [Gammaproteobacteria bacterium]
MKHFLFTILVIFSGLVTGCGNNVAPHMVGTLEWERIELVADAAEPIMEIAVHEGERVSKGQELLRLDTRRALAQLELARGVRNQAAARLAELARGTRAERILEASARLTGADQVLEVRSQELERAQQLLQQKLVSPDDIDKARAARDSARAERDAARAILNELQAGNTKEQIEQARQAVVQTDASIRLAEINLDRLTVRASSDARVDALPFRAGERPAIGNVVAVLLEGAYPYARVYVPEPLRVQVQPGNYAQVYVDGLAAPVRGKVRMVSNDPAFTPYYALTEHDRSRLSFVAKIDLVDAGQDFPGGVPVNVVMVEKAVAP